MNFFAQYFKSKMAMYLICNFCNMILTFQNAALHNLVQPVRTYLQLHLHLCI